MKRLFALILAVGIIMSLSGCGGITQVIIGADTASKGAAGELFGEEVTELFNEYTSGIEGMATMDYFPNGELGGDADLLRSLQYGDIQILVCQTAPVVSFVPEVAVFDLPMVFAQYDGDTIDEVLNGDNEFTQKLQEAFNANDLQLLGVLQNATYRLTSSNKDLSELSDFNGLLIRTMENSNHMAFWQAIDAQPTPMAFSEVYFALQSGNIQAEENAADTIVGSNFNEVQKYLACTNHILYANMMIMNKEDYDALDDQAREALEQAVSDALADLRPQLASIDDENKQTLVDRGMTLIEYDDAFFDEVLADPEVQALYETLDDAEHTNGLGTILQNELAAAAAG